MQSLVQKKKKVKKQILKFKQTREGAGKKINKKEETETLPSGIT